jgi:hypothetical protein
MAHALSYHITTANPGDKSTAKKPRLNSVGQAQLTLDAS